MKNSLLERKVSQLPSEPGIYIMKDSKGSILYVGKAKNLRHRVRSYFQTSRGDSRYWLSFLLARVTDVEYIVTDTEKEALILENNLIKQHKPRYNINFRDDKAYVLLRLSVAERFPRLRIVRKVRNDKALYFGPYASAGAARDTLRFIDKHFFLRKCHDRDFSKRLRPCLYCQMKGCLAPCCGLTEEQTYGKQVEQVILFLQGKDTELLCLLKRQMKDASEKMSFEEAARLRDQIQSIEKTLERQKIVSHIFMDKDVIGYLRHGSTLQVNTLLIRSGKLLGGEAYTLSTRPELPDKEAISSFLSQYYHSPSRFIPQEVLLPMDLNDREVIEDWLSDKKGRRVYLLVPRRGKNRDLLKMALKNAQSVYVGARESRNPMERLQKRLGLRSLPGRMECFDMSHISGTSAVGSMVRFVDMKPDKASYKRYRIKTATPGDDYSMMLEVLQRRYSRAKENGDLPDLIVVDGGKGQLNILLEVLKELNLKGMDAISLSKGKVKYLRSKKEGLRERAVERVYVPRRKESIDLGKTSPALLLLQAIRDEAHRFAIAYHKKLRKKQSRLSLLDEVPGVGSERKKALLRRFGSLQRLSTATLKDIEQTPTIPKPVARRLYEFLSRKKP